MIVRDIDSNGYQFRLILVDDLNPEDVAMVQALKARSGESSEVALKRIYADRRNALRVVLEESRIDFGDVGGEDLLDELMAISSHNDASALARRFNQQWLVGYGHKSIADCGVTTIIIEGVSMLAAKALENHPLFSGQETSTRAVDMTKAKIVDPLSTDESRAVHERFMDFYASSWDATADEVRRRYPRREGEDEKKYEAAVRYRTFDVLRAWIPAGASTHVAITMNLRQFGDHLTTLLLHPLIEVREVALAMQAALRERYPSSGSFGSAAGVSGVGTDGKEAVRDAWNRRLAASLDSGTAYQTDATRPSFRTTLKLYNDFGEFGEFGRGGIFAERPRGCLLPEWMEDLGQVSFRFELDFGSFRDIHRHFRSGTGRMPLLTTRLGFESWYIDQLPSHLQGPAVDLLALGSFTDKLVCDDTVRQYYIPMGCKVPVSATWGLKNFVYVVELRSTPQVHPTLRRAVLKHMVKPFRKAHPGVVLHVDESEDPWDLRRGQQTITEKNSSHRHAEVELQQAGEFFAKEAETFFIKVEKKS